MELPAEVLIHSPALAMKGSPGTLLQVSPHGYYEVKLTFGQNVHRVLLPVADTVIVFREPEPQFAGVEIER